MVHRAQGERDLLETKELGNIRSHQRDTHVEEGAFAEEKILDTPKLGFDATDWNEHFQTLKLTEILQRRLLSLNLEYLIFLFDYNTFIFNYLFTGQNWTGLKFNKNLQIENLTRQGLELKSLNHGREDCYSASYNY